MMNFTLRGRHHGREAWVLCGAETLPRDLERCPNDALMISANDHGCRLKRCDFIVALDDIHDRLRPWGVPVISPHAWADHQCHDPAVLKLSNSGCFGVLAAHLMGCRKIVIAGVDLYRTAYAHDPRPIRIRGTERDRLHDWAVLRSLVPSGLVFVASGPVSAIFPTLEP